MKKFFTLLAAVLIVFSLMGQNTEFNNKLKGHKSEVFKILKSIVTNNPEFSNQASPLREAKQAMDSVIFEEFFEFDEGWRNSEKQVFNWNENGQEMGYSTSGWMVEEMQWYDYIKTENSYDAQGRLSEVLTQQRDGGDWIVVSKTEYTYDTKSNITVVMSIWNLESNTWLEYVKLEYMFGTDGRLEEINNYGNLDTPPVWQNAEKYKYSYNDDGDMVLELLLWWNEETLEWDNYEKYEYTYDGAGEISMELWSDWNLVELVWNIGSKVTFSHDDYTNISGYMEYWWESDIEEWLVEEKCDYSYNNSFTFDQLLLPGSLTGYYYTFGQIVFRHMLLSELAYEADGENWLEDTRTNYYFSELNTSGVGESDLTNLVIYPNPASSYFTIDLGNSLEAASVELYDVQGRLVLSTHITSNDKVSVTKLEEGIYIFKIISNKKTYAGRVMVK